MKERTSWKVGDGATLKRIAWTVSLLFLIAGHSVAETQGNADLSVYVFYAQDCEECRPILMDFLPQVRHNYGDRLKIRFFEVNDPSNYQVLARLEEAYDTYNNQIPVFVIGEYLFGKEEVKEQLIQALSQYSDSGVPFLYPEVTEEGDYTSEPILEGEEAAEEEEAARRRESKDVFLAYFYKTGCVECDRAEYQMKYLQSKYPTLVVRKFNIQDEENKKLAEALGEMYDVPESMRMSIPEAFIGNDYLLGKEINDKNLERLIQKYLLTGTSPPWEIDDDILQQAEDTISSRFKGLEITTVISAGLLDGVNPCAFVTIVFFISYLAFVGKRGRQLLSIGFTFTLAVFLTYFLVGLGLLKFVQSISFMPAIARIVYLLTAIGAMVLAGLNFYDYAKYRKREFSESVLKLPGFIHRRIHNVVRTRSQARHYVLAAFITGLFISLLEFACTGQVYLPTIIFMTKVPALKARAIAYLFFYNLCFIVPLVIIFLLAYKGMTSEKLTSYWKSKEKGVKLGLGVMFLCLAGILIYYIPR